MILTRSAAAVVLALASVDIDMAHVHAHAHAGSLRRSSNNHKQQGRALHRPFDEKVIIGKNGVQKVIKLKDEHPHAGGGEVDNEDEDVTGEEEEEEEQEEDDIEEDEEDEEDEDDIEEEDEEEDDEDEDEEEDDEDEEEPEVDEPDAISAEEPDEGTSEEDPPEADGDLSAEDDPWDVGNWGFGASDGMIDACILLGDGEQWATFQLPKTEFDELAISKSVQGKCADICDQLTACQCEDAECNLVTGLDWQAVLFDN